MDIKQRVQDLFNRFNVDLKVEDTQRVDLAEAVLDNGTVIYTDADDFAEGEEAYIINDEGERIALPPGDYDLADGGKLSVGEGGKISAVQRGEGKGEGDKKGEGDGKGAGDGKGRGIKPGGQTKPQEPAPADPPPAKTPPKKVKKSEQTPIEMEENKEEFIDSPLTREIVQEMIREAIAEMMGDDKEEKQYEEEEEVKEEMAQVDPEAVKEVEDAPVPDTEEEPVVDLKQELSAAQAELESLKTELADMQKQAAVRGVQRMAPTKKVEDVDLSKMTTEERVRALAQKFSK